MKALDQMYFVSRNAFHEWLSRHHSMSVGIWIQFYKKHLQTPCISYEDALDEALCYGWIDSLVKRIDETRYLRKFTPRKMEANWSLKNKRRVLELFAQGGLQESGLNVIPGYRARGKIPWSSDQLENMESKDLSLPDFMRNSFSEHEPALTNFLNLAPGYRNQYVGWVTAAKRTKTQQKRLAEVIERLKANKKPGLK